MIFEDDFAIKPDFDSKLKELLDNMPKDFDMLFLNGTYGKFNKPVPFNKYLSKIGELYGTFAYIVNGKFYDVAIDALNRFKNELNTDYIYSRLMPDYKVFRAVKPIAFHHAGYSYRAEREEKNYKHLLPS